MRTHLGVVDWNEAEYLNNCVILHLIRIVSLQDLNIKAMLQQRRGMENHYVWRGKNCYWCLKIHDGVTKESRWREELMKKGSFMLEQQATCFGQNWWGEQVVVSKPDAVMLHFNVLTENQKTKHPFSTFFCKKHVLWFMEIVMHHRTWQGTTKPQMPCSHKIAQHFYEIGTSLAFFLYFF